MTLSLLLLSDRLILISMIPKGHPQANLFHAIAAYVSNRDNALHLVAVVHIKLNIYPMILQLLGSW